VLRRSSGWSLVFVLALVVALLPGEAPVYAADFIVNTTDDLADLNPGDGVCDGAPRAGLQCSLRAAVQTANALGGVHTIILGGNTYNLTNGGFDGAAVVGDLDVTATLTVIGRGQTATRIDGQDKDRVFEVHSGKLILQQLTVQNGSAGSGGGVEVGENGALELAQVTVASNVASDGGGIFSRSSLVIRSSTITGNEAERRGGGFRHEGTTALLENVVISDNRSFDRPGGGCFLGSGTATFRNVTLSRNS
jgi:CSLREA domain-containing protein